MATIADTLLLLLLLLELSPLLLAPVVVTLADTPPDIPKTILKKKIGSEVLVNAMQFPI